MSSGWHSGSFVSGATGQDAPAPPAAAAPPCPPAPAAAPAPPCPPAPAVPVGVAGLDAQAPAPTASSRVDNAATVLMVRDRANDTPPRDPADLASQAPARSDRNVAIGRSRQRRGAARARQPGMRWAKASGRMTLPALA